MKCSDEVYASRSPVFVTGQHSGLIVAHVVEGCEGGVGTSVKQLITAQAMDGSIASIHLLADPDRMGDMLLDAAAIPHHYRSSRSPRSIIRVSKIVHKQLSELRPDVVYLHSTFPGVYGRLFQTLKKSTWATIYCAHGWAFTQAISPAKKAIYSAIERALARRTDAIVSISFTEFEAALAANIDLPLHRVIYHGIVQKKLSCPPTVQLSNDGLNIAFIGRFDRQKGLDLLLEAFQDMRLQSITLWIIGIGTLGDGVQKIPDQPNIKLIGWVGNKDIDDYISCFDAIVMPSRWEGFGLVALETMRNSKPIIASRTGGLAELVIDGVNGRLFRSGSVAALRDVLIELSPSELTRMGSMAGAIFSTRFQLDRCYQSWKSLTEEALVLAQLESPPVRHRLDSDSLVGAVTAKEASWIQHP